MWHLVTQAHHRNDCYLAQHNPGHRFATEGSVAYPSRMHKTDQQRRPIKADFRTDYAYATSQLRSLADAHLPLHVCNVTAWATTCRAPCATNLQANTTGQRGIAFKGIFLAALHSYTWHRKHSACRTIMCRSIKLRKGFSANSLSMQACARAAHLRC